MTQRPNSSESPQESVLVRIAAMLKMQLLDISDSARLTELPGMDSLMLVELITRCEDDFNIRLDPEELFDVRTVRDFTALVERRIHTPRTVD